MTDTLPDFLTPLSGVRIAGRYVLDRTLGEGGMGVVVEAAYPELDQRVAIKFMRPELAANAGISARFLREAKLAARVKSPHFVRVYDVGRTEPPAVTSVPYIVMEMLSGRDLGDELAARGALPIEEAVDYILQACAGVAEIHSFGVVHRDLKPSNLFLAEQAGSRLVKVLDFGVSKDVVKDGEGTEKSPVVTATNGPVGTPHYMSPEQVRESKSVDGRSDVWAMGVVLYELLTQTLPFMPAEGGTGEVFGMILFARPEKPSTYRMEMPDGLEELILKCLERDRNLRFASILEFAEALRPFAAASSLHRISMVRDALSHRPQPSTSDLSGLSPEHSHAATIPLTPSTKRRNSPTAVTAISDSAGPVFLGSFVRRGDHRGAWLRTTGAAELQPSDRVHVDDGHDGAGHGGASDGAPANRADVRHRRDGVPARRDRVLRIGARSSGRGTDRIGRGVGVACAVADADGLGDPAVSGAGARHGDDARR